MKCKDCKEEGCPFRCYTKEGECSYEEPFINNFDWQSFRNQAAKDILCAMLTDQRISETTPYKDLVKRSLECTNELIKKLKEKEEK